MPETGPNLEETLERLQRMLKRNRWWIIATTTCVTLVTLAVQSMLPDRYRSEATLVVQQQQVSQRYVEPTTSTSPAEVVLGLTAEVLSRSRLTGIINEFGLYRKERAALAPDEVVDVMRKDLDVEPLESPGGRFDYTVFKIAFTAPSAQLAHDVTGRLTGLFIEGNTKSRGHEAAATTNFLTERVATARRRVATQEERLKAFKAAYLGELPEQQASNLGVLTDLRSQLQNTTANITRVQQQRQSLEQQRAALQASANTTLTRQQAERTALLSRFTPRHPEVQAKDQEIAKTEALLERLRGNGADKPSAGTPDDVAAAQIKAQMDSTAAELERYSRQEARLSAEIDQVQKRLNLTPVREQQLKEILRDYDLYNKDYTDLLGKQLQAQLTTSVEERQEGQQFRLAEPPTSPVSPFGPKRLRIGAGGLAGGAFLGLVVAFLLDRRDSSFFSEKMLRRDFPVPIVAGIPVLRTPFEERARVWKGALEWVVGSAIILGLCAAVYFVTYVEREPSNIAAAALQR
jgi:polysaccharide chain length determinant protein (PEP-CTERM system associated)